MDRLEQFKMTLSEQFDNMKLIKELRQLVNNQDDDAIYKFIYNLEYNDGYYKLMLNNFTINSRVSVLMACHDIVKNFDSETIYEHWITYHIPDEPSLDDFISIAVIKKDYISALMFVNKHFDNLIY